MEPNQAICVDFVVCSVCVCFSVCVEERDRSVKLPSVIARYPWMDLNLPETGLQFVMWFRKGVM